MSTEEQNQPGQHPSLTPPPADAAQVGVPSPGTPSPEAPASATVPPRSARSKAIVTWTAVFGGLALVGTAGTAAAASVSDFSRSTSEQSLDVAGIEGIDVDASAADVTVRFGDVTDAELEVSGGRGEWTMYRDDDDLVVRGPDSAFGWWFGGWFGDGQTVTLTLPQNLRAAGLDAELDLSSGALDVDADFGELDIDMSAGALSVDGSATDVTVNVSAGRADVRLDEVTEADLTVSAGDLDVELTGSAPDAVSIEVSAGTLELTLPDTEYKVIDQVSAGTLDTRIDESSDSRHTIEVTLSAGSATLRPGS